MGKAIGSKPISLWERRFKPYQLRKLIFLQMYGHIEGSHWPFAMELQYIQLTNSQAVVAEWFRRLARNQYPPGSVGSNPTNCWSFIFHQMDRHIEESDWTFANKLQCIQLAYVKAVVAEWLRWLAQNKFSSGSIGSNPTNCGSFIFHQMDRHIEESDWTFAIKLQCIQLVYVKAVVAELLRWLARNQFPSGRVGSNPTTCGSFIIHQMDRHKEGSDWTFTIKLQLIQLAYSQRENYFEPITLTTRPQLLLHMPIEYIVIWLRKSNHFPLYVCPFGEK